MSRGERAQRDADFGREARKMAGLRLGDGRGGGMKSKPHDDVPCYLALVGMESFMRSKCNQLALHTLHPDVTLKYRRGDITRRVCSQSETVFANSRFDRVDPILGRNY